MHRLRLVVPQQEKATARPRLNERRYRYPAEEIWEISEHGRGYLTDPAKVRKISMLEREMATPIVIDK